MMSMTLSSFGISTITPGLLAKFDAMQHFTLTNLMASIGMLLFLPIVGKLTDTVGRKPLLIIGGSICLVASIGAGFASSFPLFLVMRALITVGTACLAPVPSATLPFIFERSKLPQLYGIQGSFLALGSFFGSTIAGFFSDKGMAWAAAAYPGALMFLGAVIMFALCPDIPRKPMPSIDFGGMVLILFIVGPLMYAASFANRVGWGDPVIIGMLAVMVIAFICFITLEKRVKSPLVDISLFKNPVFSGALICTFLMTWYQACMRTYVPLFIQSGMGQTAAVSGSVLLPRSILNIIFPTICGAWIAKNQKSRCWQGVLFTGILIAAGTAPLSFITTSTTLTVFLVGLGLTGIAESFKQASVTPVLQTSLTAENMGSGMSLNSMIGTMGSTIGSCVYGVVFDRIAPDPSVAADLTSATNAVFMVSAVTGILVVIAAFLLIRPKKETEAPLSAS